MPSRNRCAPSAIAAGNWRRTRVRPVLSTTVWPEFGPPTRTAAVHFRSRRTISSATFPLPSEPNWPPTTTETGITFSRQHSHPSVMRCWLKHLGLILRHIQESRSAFFTNSRRIRRTGSWRCRAMSASLALRVLAWIMPRGSRNSSNGIMTLFHF